MGFVDNFRSTHDNKEILRILQKASSEIENIIWQTHAIGRTVIGVQHMEIDFVTREVVVYFDANHYHLDMNLPVYMKLDYRSSVFKVTDYQKNQNSIQFSLPKDLKTLELRGFSRHSFNSNNPHTVTLQPTTSAQNSAHEIEVKILDLSMSGIGIIISEYNRLFLKNNRILWVSKIGNKELPNPLLAEVVYMNQDLETKFSSRKEKGFKVGLKLSSALNSDFFHSIIQ